MPSRWSRAKRILITSLAVVAAGGVWLKERDRVHRAVAAFELAEFGGLRLVFDVDVDRGLADEADRLAIEIEEELRGAAPGAIARVRRGAESEIVVALADATAAQRFAQAVSPEMRVKLAQAAGASAERELRFVLADAAREELLNRLRRTIAIRLQSLTDHTVLVHSDGARLFADLPRRAAARLQRIEAAQDAPGRLRKLFVSARLEFRLVDDAEEKLAHMIQLRPEISLDWDRYQGPGGALVSAPYLSSKDRQVLRAFVQDKAPPGRVLAISRIADSAGRYRTFLLTRPRGVDRRLHYRRASCFRGIGREHASVDLSLVLRSGALAAPVRLVSAEQIAPAR